MIYENKKIPSIWTRKASYLKILKNVFDNNYEIQQIALTNEKNNELREIYNKKLKDNLILFRRQNANENQFGYDTELNTLINNQNKLKHFKKISKMKSLNEEFKEIIKKQNLKVPLSKPDSIKQNLNNILSYRKKIAARFKYNKIKLKKRFNLQLLKSKSQIINIKNKSNQLKQLLMNKKNENEYLPHVNDNDETIHKKEYEDKLMITGMNNKKYKDFHDDNIMEE